ncbi:MAG: hypothetical protein ACFE9L_11415 [Candidatus Hodarchaeota archaeon]
MSHAEDLADFGIAYAQQNGAEYAEARLIDGERTIFYLQNGNLLSDSELPWQGIGFRVLQNWGLSFVSVEDISKKSVKQAVDSGLKMARTSNPNEKIDLGEAIVNQAKWSVPVKEKITDIDAIQC